MTKKMKRKASESPLPPPPQQPYLRGCGTETKGTSAASPPPPPPQQQPEYLRSSIARSLQSADRCSETDILSAKRCGKQYLIRGNGEQVHVETLRGKLIGLLLVKSQPGGVGGLGSLIDLYNQFRESNIFDFEVVYAVIPPTHPSVFTSTSCFNTPYQLHYNLLVFTHFISTLPWLSIPFADEQWRSHLAYLYSDRHGSPLQLVIIDEHGQILNTCALSSISRYGPHVYPFKREVELQLRAKFDALCLETSMDVLLASSSNGGYLIDCNFNKVPISQLEGKHVALYNPSLRSRDSDAFFYQLVDIYNQSSRDDFEIVFINFQYNLSSYDDKKSFDDAVKEMPWLSLPFRDDNTWSLHYLLSHCIFLVDGEWYDYPTLFIRAKGESLLDPFGYHVIKQYGVQAYPFTRRAAMRSGRRRLKEKLTFESLIKRAAFLGFSPLVRNTNNDDGEVEEVSLSDLYLKEKPRGILFLFASLRTLKKEALNSLIDSYTKQPFSFEVIFVSVDKDNQSFLAHFSAMPWYAFRKQLKRKEYKKLIRRTTHLDFFNFSHFIAFGPSGNFLRMGRVPESFENRVFPFVNDVEFINFLAVPMNHYTWDVDETFGAEDRLDWLDD